MEYKQTFAERIRELRSAYGLTVEQFARLCELSSGVINNYENSKILKPTNGSLNRIIKACGTTHAWLESGEGQMLPDGLLPVNRDRRSLRTDFAYAELKNKNMKLEAELQTLWKLVESIIVKNKKSQ